jgi:hypothetical protein
MKQAGLRGCRPKKWQVTTRPDKEAAAKIPDLVRRDFTAATAGAKLVGDITYVVRREALRRIPYSIGRNLEECS